MTLLLFMLLFSTVQESFAKPSTVRLTCASATGIKTEAELQFDPSQKVSIVNVTFIAKRPSDKEIDRVVRDCVAAAVKRDASKDILGSPWFRKRPTDNQDDDDLLHPYGGLRFLSYEAVSKGIGVREMKLQKKSP